MLARTCAPPHRPLAAERPEPLSVCGKKALDLSSSRIENPAKPTPPTASAQQVGEWHPKARAGNATLSRLVRRQRADFVQVKTLWAG